MIPTRPPQCPGPLGFIKCFAARSKEHPDGIPSHLGGNMGKLREANRVTKNTFELMKEDCIKNIPWSVENPCSSLLWSTRGWKQLTRKYKLKKVVLDYCRYGMPYRKRTTIYTWDPDNHGFLTVLAKRCQCTKPHMTLGGWGRKGNCIPTAAGSAAYPEQLCNAWAQAVHTFLH